MTEIDSYVSYLEDIKKDKLVSYKEMIGELEYKDSKMIKRILRRGLIGEKYD